MSSAETKERGKRPKISKFRIIFITTAVFLVIYILKPKVSRPPFISPQMICRTNLASLGWAIKLYSEAYDDKYPTADKWCDLLIQYCDVTPKQFICRDSNVVEGESSYAFNKYLVGKKVSEVSDDVVLLFETNFGKNPNGRDGVLGNRNCYRALKYSDPNRKVYKLRWNQVGGPELLSIENHQRKGCNILFNSMHVEFVKPEQFKELLWQDPGIHKAVLEGNIEKVRTILNEKVTFINLKDSEARTPLYLAIEKRNKEMVHFLIANGANVNSKNYYNCQTLLHKATRMGDGYTVELLVAKGADVNGRESDGSTPLHRAAKRKNSSIVEFLVSKGADVKIKDLKNQTALHYLASSHYSLDTLHSTVRTAEILIANGCPVNDESSGGNTALCLAATKGLHKVVGVLLENGADINAESKALLEIAERNCLRKAPSPGPQDKDTFFALLKYSDIKPELVEQMTLVRAELSDKNASLLDAAQWGSKYRAEFLIANGADVNCRNDYGETPLHRTVFGNHIDVVELLIANGAEVNARHKYGDTPLRHANRLGRSKLAELLRKHGGVE